MVVNHQLFLDDLKILYLKSYGVFNNQRLKITIQEIRPFKNHYYTKQQIIALLYQCQHVLDLISNYSYERIIDRYCDITDEEKFSLANSVNELVNNYELHLYLCKYSLKRKYLDYLIARLYKRSLSLTELLLINNLTSEFLYPTSNTKKINPIIYFAETEREIFYLQLEKLRSIYKSDRCVIRWFALLDDQHKELIIRLMNELIINPGLVRLLSYKKIRRNIKLLFSAKK